MPLLSIGEDVVHILLVGLSAIVLSVALIARERRRTWRYLFLPLAFAFLTSSEIVSLIETIFLSDQMVILPVAEIHLTHFLEFLMLFSFGIALVKK